MIQKGEYGPVHVVNGKFQGRYGYYDDDSGDFAVVYFGPFLETNPEYIHHTNLLAVTKQTSIDFIENQIWPADESDSKTNRTSYR